MQWAVYSDGEMAQMSTVVVVVAVVVVVVVVVVVLRPHYVLTVHFTGYNLMSVVVRLQ